MKNNHNWKEDYIIISLKPRLEKVKVEREKKKKLLKMSQQTWLNLLS